MQNAIQPFINLANANISAFTRFAQSPEISRLAQDNTSRIMTMIQESMGKAAQTEAFAEMSQALVENSVRFMQEYTESMYGLMLQGQEAAGKQFQQAEQGVQRLARAR